MDGTRLSSVSRPPPRPGTLRPAGPFLDVVLDLPGRVSLPTHVRPCPTDFWDCSFPFHSATARPRSRARDLDVKVHVTRSVGGAVLVSEGSTVPRRTREREIVSPGPLSAPFGRSHLLRCVPSMCRADTASVEWTRGREWSSRLCLGPSGLNPAPHCAKCPVHKTTWDSF